MVGNGTKLVYFNGKPQWLLPDGSFVPERVLRDVSMAPGALYLKDKNLDVLHLIRD